MKLIHLAALMAVAMTAIACDSTTRLKNLETIQVPADQATSPDDMFGQYEKKEEEFRNDTTGKQQPPADKQEIHKPDPALRVDWDKKIIKTAVLNIETREYDNYYNSVREKIRALGGYIAQEDQVQTGYKIQNSMTIKVPVEEFDNAIQQVSANSEHIHEKKINSQDVTTEIIDTRSRVEAKKQVRHRYLELLKQAKNMEEILRVQSVINEVQVEIETAAGRVAHLRQSSAFSTIHLTYFQVLNASGNGGDTPGIATRIGLAFGTGWSWMIELFIVLVSIWPLCLLILVCVIGFKKLRLQKVNHVKH